MYVYNQHTSKMLVVEVTVTFTRIWLILIGRPELLGTSQFRQNCYGWGGRG